MERRLGQLDGVLGGEQRQLAVVCRGEYFNVWHMTGLEQQKL